MNRKKRILVLSHCILNANAKVEGLSSYGAIMGELIKFTIDSEIGLIQLPCPEMAVLGIKRWGHVKEQLDNLHIRRTCREILKSTVDQICDYNKNGYELIGLVGIDGSPSCGINKTCSSGTWGGETSDKEELWQKIDTVKLVDGRGVFMEELMDMLSEEDISLRMFSIEEDKFELSIEKLLERLKDTI